MIAPGEEFFKPKWTPPGIPVRDSVLGIHFHRLTRWELLESFRSAMRDGDRVRFSYLNIAVANLAHNNRQLSNLLNESELTYIDGAGIGWGLRLVGKAPEPRHTGADFLPEVLRICAEEKRTVGMLGGWPGSARRLAEVYRERIPGLEIVFVRDGFRDLEDEAGWRRELQENPPNLLMVGMGVPRQEFWIRDHFREFPINLYWSVGALFEYDSGGLPRCPEWMGRAGLEWLYRLYCEPGRLWKRYLIGNPLFLLRCLCSRWRGRGGTC